MRGDRLLLCLALLQLTGCVATPSHSPMIDESSGAILWFVASDHLHLQEEYPLPGYAYVTVVDNMNFDDPPGRLAFTSSLQDTERVSPHLVRFAVAFPQGWDFGGTSIYLAPADGPVVGDGVLQVPLSGGMIRAEYLSTIRPTAPQADTAFVRAWGPGRR